MKSCVHLQIHTGHVINTKYISHLSLIANSYQLQCSKAAILLLAPPAWWPSWTLDSCINPWSNGPLVQMAGFHMTMGQNQPSQQLMDENPKSSTSFVIHRMWTARGTGNGPTANFPYDGWFGGTATTSTLRTYPCQTSEFKEQPWPHLRRSPRICNLQAVVETQHSVGKLLNGTSCNAVCLYCLHRQKHHRKTCSATPN